MGQAQAAEISHNADVGGPTLVHLLWRCDAGIVRRSHAADCGLRRQAATSRDGVHRVQEVPRWKSQARSGRWPVDLVALSRRYSEPDPHHRMRRSCEADKHRLHQVCDLVWVVRMSSSSAGSATRRGSRTSIRPRQFRPPARASTGRGRCSGRSACAPCRAGRWGPWRRAPSSEVP